MVRSIDHVSTAVWQLTTWLTSLLDSLTRICSVVARSRSIHSATAESVSGPRGLVMVPVAIPQVFLCLRMEVIWVLQASQLLVSALNLSFLAKEVMAIGAQYGWKGAGLMMEDGTVVVVVVAGAIAVAAILDWVGGTCGAGCGALDVVED